MDDKNKITNSERITVQVLRQDQNVVHVIMRKNTPLGKLMKAYCGKAGLNMQAVHFRFDGNLINETDTVTSLDMEDMDIIEVHQ